jgi:hypothetical protein
MMNHQLMPVNIKASDEKLKGEYSNMMQVIHTKEEFVLDFMNVFPPTGTLNSRIIVNPNHIKRMIRTLEFHLKKYEDEYGNIKVSEPPQQAVGFQA